MKPKSVPAADEIWRLVSSDRKICVRVTPNAKSESIAIASPELGAPPVLQIRVTVPPEGGKANATVIALLAKALGIRKSAISIAHGETGRNKILEIAPSV